MTLKNFNFDTARLTKRVVHSTDIDDMGYVNNIVYVSWVQEAANEHWNVIASEAIKEKYLWFCSRHEIDYRQQLYASQDVQIRTWLGESIGARFDRYVDIRATGSNMPAVIAKTTWVLLSKSSRRPIRIQPEILTAFS